MGPHTEDGEGSGHISVQCSEEAHREAAAEEDIRELVVPASSGGTVGSGPRGDT